MSEKEITQRFLYENSSESQNLTFLLASVGYTHEYKTILFFIYFTAALNL